VTVVIPSAVGAILDGTCLMSSIRCEEFRP